MNHKRGRAKNQRAGCLMCKPQKMNGAGSLKLQVQKTGFGNIRNEYLTRQDIKDDGH